mmetsp:Transcript_1832/g.4384  ORF Transcript_1832/g.4384 Transcript_1832/m.4384 type:complete len:201 (+) Transcript_1832:690-1292(+)
MHPNHFDTPSIPLSGSKLNGFCSSLDVTLSPGRPTIMSSLDSVSKCPINPYPATIAIVNPRTINPNRLNDESADISSTMLNGTKANPRIIPSNNLLPVVNGVASTNERMATSNAILMKSSSNIIIKSIDQRPKSPKAYQPSFENVDVPSGGASRNLMLNRSHLQHPKILSLFLWHSKGVMSAYSVGVSAKQIKYSRASQS